MNSGKIPIPNQQHERKKISDATRRPVNDKNKVITSNGPQAKKNAINPSKSFVKENKNIVNTDQQHVKKKVNNMTVNEKKTITGQRQHVNLTQMHVKEEKKIGNSVKKKIIR